MGCEQIKIDSKIDAIIVPLATRIQRHKKVFGFLSSDFDLCENVTKMNYQIQSQEFQILEDIIAEHYLLCKLQPNERARLIQCFQVFRSDKQSIIFKKGDPASLFFVIKKGKVQVQACSTNKNILDQGECFGELALIYRSPRSATIKAIEDCQFYCISYKLFRKTMQEIMIRNFDFIKKRVMKASIFKFLTLKQKIAIACNSQILTFCKGDYIFREGDDANAFYIIGQGSVEILIAGKNKIFMKTDQSFGETSIQKGQQRVGTAIAIEPTTLISIGTKALKRCIKMKIQDLSFINIIRWSFQRNQILRNLSSYEMQKIISVAQFKYYETASLIVQKGVFSRQFFVCLSGTLNQQSVGSFHNIQYMLESPNDRKTIKDLIKTEKGYVAYFNFELLVQILGPKNLSKYFQKPIKIQINKKKKEEYIQRINIYDLKVKFLLGENSFGAKFLCVEDQCQNLYVLKCIRKKQSNKNQIQIEKSILSKIQPFFSMKLYRVFEQDQFTYFLIKYEGKFDLCTIFQKIGYFTKEKVQFYIGSLICALEYLHNRSIIYRDLRPQTVGITKEGFPYLADFSYAKFLEEQNGYRTFTLLGSPHYIAPEVIMGRGYSFSADIWSLGVILYEMLCNRLPFGNQSDDPYQIFQQIENTDEITIPKLYTNSDGIQLIKLLLIKDQTERNIEHFSKIKCLNFFEGFDWWLLEHHQIQIFDLPKDNEQISEISPKMTAIQYLQSLYKDNKQKSQCKQMLSQKF